MLSTIEQFRNRLLAVTSSVDPHPARPTVDGIAELDRTRAEITRTLNSYNLFLHREIFTPILETGSPGEISAAREIKIECIGLTEEFRVFTAKWRTADAESNWDSYQPAAHAFRQRIIAHVEQVTRLAELRVEGRATA